MPGAEGIACWHKCAAVHEYGVLRLCVCVWACVLVMCHEQAYSRVDFGSIHAQAFSKEAKEKRTKKLHVR